MPGKLTIDELFEQYKKATGGEERLGYIVPFGLPDGVEERGGIEAVYRECIEKKVTWEKLLDFNPPDDAVM